MVLLPAIDIRHGRVVRLSQGEAERETVYGDDPVAIAERFVAEGARWIHLVDLDRAFGEGHNAALVARVITAVGGASVQLGGGFRSLAAIDEAMALGAARVVIGTAAVSDPGLVSAALARTGAERLAVGIDARDGVVAIRGWREAGRERVDELARRVAGQGIQTLVYTDVTRDGMLQGPDIDGALRLQTPGCSVIVSGGVSSLADLHRVREAGLAGAIVGRAIYEARLTVADAVAALTA